MAKQPAFQFYPGDWLKDAELRLCSHFARGLLVDLLCVMFEAKHRGRFVCVDGVTPWTDLQIVDSSAGGSRDEKLAALDELLRHGVLKRDTKGVVYSSRMLRDEEIRLERTEAGSKGGSKTQANRQANGQANCQAKSRSSSSSSSSDITGTGTEADSDSIKASKPVRRFAAIDCRVGIRNQDAIAAVRMKPFDRAKDRTLQGIPSELGNADVAEWWLGHIGGDPLTGETALDLLLVLCCAAKVRKGGYEIRNKPAKLAAMIASGEWLLCSTDITECYKWMQSHMAEWVIAPEKEVVA